MNKRTTTRVLAELKSINTFDMWVADSIKLCIELLEADLSRRTGKGSLPPHQSHSDTSRAAAKAIAPKLGTVLSEVLQQIAQYGSTGLTDEEGQRILDIQGNSYRPCRVMLMDRGFVFDSGIRRKTRQGKDAVVWYITREGLLAWDSYWEFQKNMNKSKT